MAATGWYPDPAGANGRYRYWDGSRWSNETTDDPTAPPPHSDYGQNPQGQRPHQPGQQAPAYGAGAQPAKRRPAMIIGALAVLVVLILVVVLAVRALTDQGSSVLDDPDPPQSSVSGWDDSSPLPTATPSPTQSPEPTDSAEPQGAEACATGNPEQRQSHPTGDNRTYGGDLSFPKPSGYDDSQSYTWTMSWAYDTDGVDATTEPGWASLLAVGYVRDTDGFHTPKQAADGIMQCIASSGYYRNFSDRKNVSSKKVTVDGKPGWAMRSEIRVDKPGLSVEGDLAEVVVVDTGTEGQLSFFGGFVPIGDKPRTRILDQTIDGLRVD